MLQNRETESRSGAVGLGLLLAVTVALTPAVAQDRPPVETLDFDHPEAWAMKWFNSASLLTALGPVERREVGSVELGFEALSIPHLSAEERTVGFGGVKEEDLNRTPVAGRLRVTVGLPAGLALTLGWVPPAAVGGVESNLLSAALERQVLTRGRWRLGLRLFTQIGDSEGDFTCSAKDASIPAGAPGNAFGCEAASADTVTLEYTGLEAVGSYAWPGGRRPVLHFGVAAQYMDLQFQVRARTFGFEDRTLLLTDGWTYSGTFGATWAIGSRSRLGTEIFYSPLTVDRLGSPGHQNDALFNVRALFRVRLR